MMLIAQNDSLVESGDEKVKWYPLAIHHSIAAVVVDAGLKIYFLVELVVGVVAAEMVLPPCAVVVVAVAAELVEKKSPRRLSTSPQ
jgi:hypothetical protein